MPRLEGKKSKLRQGTYLAALPGSEEHLSTPGIGTHTHTHTRTHTHTHTHTGSQDSLGRPDKEGRKKRGDKDRNSFTMDRTHSEGSKDRPDNKKGSKGHKRQRSWGGNKLLEVDTGGKLFSS